MAEELVLRIDLNDKDARRQADDLDGNIRDLRRERQKFDRTTGQLRRGADTAGSTAGRSAVVGAVAGSKQRAVGIVRQAFGALALTEALSILGPVLSEGIKATPGVPEPIKAFTTTAIDSAFDTVQKRISEIQASIKTAGQAKELLKAFAVTGNIPPSDQLSDIGTALFSVNAARAKFDKDVNEALLRVGTRNTINGASKVFQKQIFDRLNRTS